MWYDIVIWCGRVIRRGIGMLCGIVIWHGIVIWRGIVMLCGIQVKAFPISESEKFRQLLVSPRTTIFNYNQKVLEHDF